MENITAIILAAGKGKRMNVEGLNKVTHHVSGVPMIKRTLNALHDAGIQSTVVVVGHEKQSVLDLLPDGTQWVEQKELLGTGHAVRTALPKVPKSSDTIFVLYGDDSYFLTPEIIKSLHSAHIESNSDITFVTIEKENPFALGRILRDKSGKLKKIVEERDATEEEKLIHEINAGCFMMKKDFVESHIGRLNQNNAQGEYYITDLVALALADGMKVETVRLGNISWRGINTKEELEEAQKLFVK